MANSDSPLRTVIKNSKLTYKQVSTLMGCSESHVSVDVGKNHISVERAYKYGRALKIDPAILRPDVFKTGEVKYR